MAAKRLNAAQRIKQAMRANERMVLALARRRAAEGLALDYCMLGLPGMNAADRLKARGVLRYSKVRFGFVPTKKAVR